MKDTFHINAKRTGMTLIAISVVLIIIFLSSTSEIMKSENIACTQTCGIEMDINGTSCPHENSIPVQSYAGFTISLILGGIGTYVILSGRKHEENAANEEKKLEKTLNSMNDEEKKIYGFLKDGNGAIFQSELMEKTGLAKVKISRLLDKLEAKGIVERKRRGMTNLVLLKR